MVSFNWLYRILSFDLLKRGFKLLKILTNFSDDFD
jgi:hypothetical protein